VNALVPIQPGRETNAIDLLELANLMAKSGFFADARDAAQAVVKILAGREMGFGPFQSMAGIFIVKGKPTLAAILMAAAVLRSGRYDYKVLHLDDQKCEIEYFRDGKSVGISVFTMEDAKKAGLAGNDNWKKYPRNMLFARAMSNGVKWYCPDVFGGPVYTPDELGEAVDAEECTVINVSPEPAAVVLAKVTISPEQKEDLQQLINRKGADTDKLCAYYEVGSVADLTPDQFAEAVGRLRGRPDVSQEPHSAEPASVIAHSEV
jgi:hypothetical protein